VQISLNNLKTVISILIKTLRMPYSYGRRRNAKKWEKIVESDEKLFD